MNQFNISGKLALSLIIMLLFVQLACTQLPISNRQPNSVPVIQKMVFPKDVFANSDVQIECLASDVDGDNLTYQWNAESGKITGQGLSIFWSPPAKLGIYPINLAVSDGRGGVATENISIRVLTNADGTATPSIDVHLRLGDVQPVIVDQQRARIWTTTDIVCIVDNSEGKQLNYTWSANGGKITGKGVQDGKADRIGWTAPGSQADSAIYIAVSDNQGSQAKGQVNIHVFCCGN